VIKTQAGLYDSWKCCDLTYGRHLNASVTKIYADTLLGVEDSVQEISFQAYNIGGDSVPHIMNGKQIVLGKLLGLLEWFDIHLFPNDTTRYFLAGKSHLQIGIQLVPALEMFDFDIGDEFHYDNENSWGHWYHTMKTVLEKTIYGDVDSIVYKYERCYVEYRPQPPPNTFFIHDTIIETIDLTNWYWLELFNKLPDEFIRLDEYSAHKYFRKIGSHENRVMVAISYLDYNYYSQNCWRDNWPDMQYYEEFHCEKGLGYTYYITREVLGSGFIGEYISSLVYYRKGSEVWGTPWASDCFTLVGVDYHEAPDVSLSIYPNPASGSIISIKTDHPGELTILDLQGKSRLRQAITEPTTTIDVSDLKSGVYVVKIVGEKGVEVGKFVKQ